jgi:hypothetical protein
VKVAVSCGDAALWTLACGVAASHGTDARTLHLRLLLHLPRLAGEDGVVAAADAEVEAARLVARMPPGASFLVAAPWDLDDLRFSSVEPALARRVCEQLHYLGSHRTRARQHGLTAPDGSLVALAMTTGCDVDLLRSHALAHLDDERPRVLARVFSVGNAPENTLTRLFKLVRQAERARGTRSLVTYVNPNMGFTGASYRAGGWQPIGEEPGTTYRYVDGDYRTDRSLAAALDLPKVDDLRLHAHFGRAYERSRMPLAPLLILGRRC